MKKDETNIEPVVSGSLTMQSEVEKVSLEGESTTTVFNPDEINQLVDKLFHETSKKKEGNPASTEEVEGIMNKLLSLSWVEEDLKNACMEDYILDIEDDICWMFNVSLKTMLPVKKGASIVPIDNLNEDETYCLIGTDMYVVDNLNIKCLGWN